MTKPLDLATLSALGIHELKNLLGELTLTLDQLAQTADPELGPRIADARFVCGRIRDRMVALLALYRLDGGRQAFALEAHCPADLAADVAAELDALAAGRLRVEMVAHEPPPFWFLDRELVRSALLNAGHNALGHARARVRLEVGTEAGMLLFRLCDDGPGYPPSLLAADLAHAQPSQHGTGLGLHFAHAVARAHHHGDRVGQVRLANVPDGGAVFSLLLP